MNNPEPDYKTLASSWHTWSRILGTFAAVFLSVWQAGALEHVAYPAFYPSVPSSANGDTTYTYVWASFTTGGNEYTSFADSPWDSLSANTTDEISVNGNSTYRGFAEYYNEAITYDFTWCPVVEISTYAYHCAQWGTIVNGVPSWYPSDSTVYDVSNPPGASGDCGPEFWSPFAINPISGCGTTTTHYQGTDVHGALIWTVDYTFETNPCYFYTHFGFWTCGLPPWISYTVSGICPYYKIVVWMKRGVTPPSLASLGIGTPAAPGTVGQVGGTGGGGPSQMPPYPIVPLPRPPSNFPGPINSPPLNPPPNGPLGSKIAAGGCHSLAVKADGSVWAWGDDWYDTLGVQGSGSITNPVHVNGISNVVAVAAGLEHSLALDVNGCVWGWGDDTVGQLGISYPMTGYYIPQQLKTSGYAPMTNIICIAASCDGYNSYAVSSNGYVLASGDNSYGQLGLGYSGGQVPVFLGVHNLSGIVSVAAGQYHVLALTTNGLVYAWGLNNDGQLGNGTSGNGSYIWNSTPTLVTNLTNTVIVAIAAGAGSSYALDNNGNVWQWGNGITTPAFVSGLDPANGIVIIGITAGYSNGFALAADGSYWAWGPGGLGELGNGSTSGSTVPVHVNFPDGTQSLGIAASTQFSLSIQYDGTLRSWGDNRACPPYTHSTGCGQLGRDTGPTGYATTPGPVNPF